MMFNERLSYGGRQIGTGGVGVGFDLNHVPHRDELPLWMVDHIRKAEKVSTIQHLAFAAQMWLKGYGRLADYGLPTMTRETTQEPSWMGPLYNWDDPFWKASEQRATDRNFAVANPMFWRTTKTSTISPIKAATRAVSSAVKSVEKIPVVGNVVNLVERAYTAPIEIGKKIASGERLDHVAMDALKSQIKLAKDAAPYAATVVALVPGIGTGAAAAISAGAALAEGKSIDEATKAAIRGALPGGALAQVAFDVATKVASGEKLEQAALESARNQLPPGPQQAAFDIGVAVAHGEKIQNAVAKGLVNLAGTQVQTVLADGVKALATTPGLADALKQVPPGAAEEGFKLAAGLLSKSGVGEKAVAAVRDNLPSDMKQGFDAALKSQEAHYAWVKNVTGQPALRTAPKPAAKPGAAPAKPAGAPAIKTAPKGRGKYGPYPHLSKGAVHGLGAADDTDSGGSGATPWVAGGILVALAVGAFALEKKGPEPFRYGA